MQRSALETKSDNIALMGQALGALYSELWQDVARLHSDWEEYVVMFGTNPGRIDLLNRSAGHFFRVVQDSLWERTLLHISRLIDPPKSAGKPNLSIQRLPPEVVDQHLKQILEPAIADSLAKCAFAKEWRNRQLAHKDLGLALGHEVDPLSPASRLMVKEAIASITEVLNTISKHYLDSTTFFDFTATPGSALDLLYLLHDGLQAQEARRQRIESGVFEKGDLKSYDI
jgi:hypothetical protein